MVQEKRIVLADIVLHQTILHLPFPVVGKTILHIIHKNNKRIFCQIDNDNSDRYRRDQLVGILHPHPLVKCRHIAVRKQFLRRCHRLDKRQKHGHAEQTDSRIDQNEKCHTKQLSLLLSIKHLKDALYQTHKTIHSFKRICSQPLYSGIITTFSGFGFK